MSNELDALRARVRDLEARLAIAQRVGKGGELPSLPVRDHGLLHDFQNLLSGIIGHAALLQSAAEPGSETHETSGVIILAAERAAVLAGMLVDRASPAEGSRGLVDLHEVIAEVRGLLGRTLSPNISLRTELKATSPFVKGDGLQIHQMMLNLALNARDALAAGGGVFRISTAMAAHEGREGVEITVADNGPGIPAGIQAQVFDPYFTTKPPGKGTGLGLAIVRRVVDIHGGTLQLKSSPGAGCEFRVWLPAEPAAS